MLFKIKATVQVKKKKGKTGKPFNPLTFDVANLLALYDGDSLLTDPLNTWSDQSGNGYDLTLFNNPPGVAAAINGHDAIQFDGINQYATRATPAMNQPYTIYSVTKTLVALGGAHIYNDGVNNNFKIFGQELVDMYIYAGTAPINSNPDPAVNTWALMTLVFNAANSQIRTNNNAAVIGNPGNLNGNGITLATRPGGVGSWWNGEYAYLIIRSGADSTATQNLFINWLKSRFAI